MAEATWYSQGAFCWAECSTNDVEGAKAFYGGLFGLEAKGSPTPTGGEGYWQLQQGGKNAAGLTAQPAEEAERGVPPHWHIFIAVDDVDAVASEAARLGAKVIVPPSDVLEMGRMAAVEDPSGASVGFWQAKEHIGAQVYAEPGTVTWWELMTQDTAKAIAFYAGLFGYETEEFPSVTGPYTVLKHKGENAAGIMAAPQSDLPSMWTPYFESVDADATFAKATELGAEALMPVTDVEGIGRFAWVRDPQGAVTAFIEPAPREA